jgi:hypothetical protein
MLMLKKIQRKIFWNFVIRNSHIWIVIRDTKLSLINVSCEDKRNDIKKLNYI